MFRVKASSATKAGCASFLLGFLDVLAASKHTPSERLPGVRPALGVLQRASADHQQRAAAKVASLEER